MTATPTPKPRSRDRKVGLAIVGAIVLAVAAVSAGYVVGLGAPASDAASAGSGSATASARPAPETGEAVAPVPEPTAQPSSLVPAECAGIYSSDWSGQMGGLVLNPAWTRAADASAVVGSNDEELNAMLAAAAPLRCQWAGDLGPSDLGLITSVAQLQGEKPAAALARMNTLGYTCYDELGGTRCIIEQNDDGATWGESHFIRDGVWVATRWVNIGPDGYTHDIVNTLWP